MGSLIVLYNNSFFTHSWTTLEISQAIAIIVVSYLALIYWIIPSFMKNREPYKLTTTLLVYNSFQVLFSAYCVFHHARYAYNYGIITSRCATGDELPLIRAAVFPYFLAKHIDLLDTVFFALRKKNNQITLLHVFHHVSVLAWMWFLILYPTDHLIMSGLLNNFVHVIMYAYYGIASLGPKYAKYITWKKNLTKIQLIQFFTVLLILYSQQNYTPCPLPLPLYYYGYFCIYTYVILFSNFYIRSYNRNNIQLNKKK